MIYTIILELIKINYSNNSTFLFNISLNLILAYNNYTVIHLPHS
ncbi:MAG: hypothetical protein ACKESC_00935 [Candidatus Hodgkinia cicadicola]